MRDTARLQNSGELPRNQVITGGKCRSDVSLEWITLSWTVSHNNQPPKARGQEHSMVTPVDTLHNSLFEVKRGFDQGICHPTNLWSNSVVFMSAAHHQFFLKTHPNYKAFQLQRLIPPPLYVLNPAVMGSVLNERWHLNTRHRKSNVVIYHWRDLGC